MCEECLRARRDGPSLRDPQSKQLSVPVMLLCQTLSIIDSSLGFSLRYIFSVNARDFFLKGSGPPCPFSQAFLQTNICRVLFPFFPHAFGDIRQAVTALRPPVSEAK